jgi:cytochrome P450
MTTTSPRVQATNTPFDPAQEHFYLPPGPAGFPVVGNIPQFRRDPLNFLEGVQRAYGSVATIYFLHHPAVLAFRPEHAYDILVERARVVTIGDRPGLRERLGASLLTTDGATHRRQRRLVQPAFHRKRVEGYVAIMTRYTSEMASRWHVGDELDIAAALREVTLRIIIQALFDLDLAEEGSRLSHLFGQAVERHRTGFGSVLPLALMNRIDALNARARALPLWPGQRSVEEEAPGTPAEELDAFVYRLIAERRADGSDHGDVLSMLLDARDEAGQPLNDVEVRDQAMTLIVAGHETTFTALSWALDLLARHTHAYQRLCDEVASVLNGELPGAADLPRLEYLDAVILESLRLRPPAWIIDRVTLAPFDLAGYHLPAGTPLLVSPWLLHHSPELWGDADAFRPERWLDGGARSLPRGSYLPFGLGPRMCIGMPLADMEMRLVLATVLQRVAPMVVPGFRPIARPRVTLRLANGLRVRLDPVASASHSARPI